MSTSTVTLRCASLQGASRAAIDGLEADLAFCHPAIRGIASVDAAEGTLALLVEGEPDRADLEKQVEAVVERSVASHRNAEAGPPVWQHTVAGPYPGRAAIQRFAERFTRATGPGQQVYVGPAAELFEKLDRRFRRIALAVGAESWVVPNIEMNDELLDKTHYLASYPHIVTFGYHLPPHFDTIQNVAAGARKRSGADWSALQRGGVLLQPAVCHNVYRACRGEDMGAGRTVTFSSRAYRYEGFRFRPLLRGWEFTVREIVMLGAAEWVDEQRLKILAMMQDAVKELDLSATVGVATDPFFVTEAGSRRAMQVIAATKLEFRFKIDEGADAAAASLNRHGKHFSKPMGITSGGALGETACVGFGIDRWIAAFVARWGDEPARWPALPEG